jgi:hypothetical protein
MTERTTQIAPAQKYQRSDATGKIEQAGALKSLDAHGGLAFHRSVFKQEFATILKLFLLAAIPLLNGSKKPTNAGINFGFGVTLGSHGWPPYERKILKTADVRLCRHRADGDN